MTYSWIRFLILFSFEFIKAQGQHEFISAKFEGDGISKLIFTDSPAVAIKFAEEDIANGKIY